VTGYLHSLATALTRLEKWEVALPAEEEAESLYRQLASADSAQYIERWHKARKLLAYILAALDRGEEASAVSSRTLH
jgi:hypothetical protein